MHEGQDSNAGPEGVLRVGCSAAGVAHRTVDDGGDSKQKPRAQESGQGGSGERLVRGLRVIIGDHGQQEGRWAGRDGRPSRCVAGTVADRMEGPGLARVHLEQEKELRRRWRGTLRAACGPRGSYKVGAEDGASGTPQTCASAVKHSGNSQYPDQQTAWKFPQSLCWWVFTI